MDAESLKSAQNLDESEYETDEEALGRDNSKLFPNFHSFILFLIQRIILIYIVLRFFPFPVHVSVSGTLQEDLRNLKLKDFSFIDINSRAPLLVIGNQIFSGEYQDSVGTSVFFTPSENDQQQDKVFNRQQCNVSVDYYNSTRKKLILKRVFLNKKSGSGKESSQGYNQGSEDSSSKK